MTEITGGFTVVSSTDLDLFSGQSCVLDSSRDDERRLGDDFAVDQFEVHRALDQAQRMVSIALSTFRECRENTTSMVELYLSEEELKPVLAQLLHRSYRTPVQLYTVWRPQQKIETHPSLLRQLVQHPRGNEVRILTRPDAAMSPEGETQLDELNSQHCKVRVHHERLPDLTILNKRIAILRTAGDDGPSKIFLINATDIVHSLSLLYTATWQKAIDLDEFRQHGIERDDDIASQVLDLLSNGCKDETAARQLGLSVRTYRRYVAGLMDRLAATSRFQAGAQAARLGLIGGIPEQRSG